jgi:hypothetical protein
VEHILGFSLGAFGVIKRQWQAPHLLYFSVLLRHLTPLDYLKLVDTITFCLQILVNFLLIKEF